jgi:prepilin-type N-terminal cleavage/methylation domain-containing protein
MKNITETPKKSRKRVKGMTLIECIIALAVFGIMAVVMIAGCVHVYNSKKSTDKTIKRNSYETPAVANKSRFTGSPANGANPAVEGDVVQGSGQITIGGVAINYTSFDAVDANGTPGLGYFVRNDRPANPTDDTDDTDDTNTPETPPDTPVEPPVIDPNTPVPPTP